LHRRRVHPLGDELGVEVLADDLLATPAARGKREARAAVGGLDVGARGQLPSDAKIPSGDDDSESDDFCGTTSSWPTGNTWPRTTWRTPEESARKKVSAEMPTAMPKTESANERRPRRRFCNTRSDRARVVIVAPLAHYGSARPSATIDGSLHWPSGRENPSPPFASS
jgi:hypothetical protein